MFPREGPIVSSKKMIRLWWLTLKFLAEHPNWLVSVHTCHHASSVALQSKPERRKQDHFHKHVYKVLTEFTMKCSVTRKNSYTLCTYAFLFQPQSRKVISNIIESKESNRDAKLTKKKVETVWDNFVPHSFM